MISHRHTEDPKEEHPKKFTSIIRQYLKNDVMLNKNFWKYFLIFGFSFISSKKLLEYIVEPKLSKFFVNIVKSHSKKKTKTISTTKVNFSIKQAAENASRINSTIHSLTQTILQYYFWRKYKRTQNDLKHSVQIELSQGELLLCDFSNAYFIVDIIYIFIYDRYNYIWYIHHLCALLLFFTFKASKRFAPIANFIGITGEFSTIFLNIMGLVRSYLKTFEKYLIKIALNDKNIKLKYIENINKLCSCIFLLSYIYCRIYLYTKVIPDFVPVVMKETKFEKINPVFTYILISQVAVGVIISWIWAGKIIQMMFK